MTERLAARLISRLEDGDQEAYSELAVLAPQTPPALVIGVTGPPGSGKSTLTDKLIASFRSRGLKVGILAVDPSSPFSGGAILGDRLRMQGHATDPGVFIRSLASRGKLGGLSRATALAAKVLDAAGYQIIIIETVGVGQSEVDIVKVADTVLLISVPGLGDEIQVLKAGIMEIGDIFVVNKSDREGSDRVVREIRAMLETQAMLRSGGRMTQAPDTLASRNAEILHHGLSEAGPTPESDLHDDYALGVLPPVLKTVAETGQGVEELAEAILARFSRMNESGELGTRRIASIKSQIRDLVALQVHEQMSGDDGEALLDAQAKRVHDRSTDLVSAAREIFVEISKGERK
jgi:LAO/AO transport system kinase